YSGRRRRPACRRAARRPLSYGRCPTLATASRLRLYDHRRVLAAMSPRRTLVLVKRLLLALGPVHEEDPARRRPPGRALERDVVVAAAHHVGGIVEIPREAAHVRIARHVFLGADGDSLTDFRNRVLVDAILAVEVVAVVVGKVGVCFV